MTGKELKQTRTRLRLTQPELGKLIGRRTETISRWEHDTKPIPKIVELALEALEKKDD